jgi:hypothetical protein
MKGLIVEETCQARHAHAKQLNCDLDAIAENLRKRKKESSLPIVSLSPRRMVEKGTSQKFVEYRPVS